MKTTFLSVVITCVCTFACACQPKLKPPPEPYDKSLRAIMMGDSITEIWNNTRGSFFGDNNILSAGIGGQTSTQMLARFEDDVVKRSPKAVSILCGINDIAQNQGYISNEDISSNIASMAAKAAGAGIKVILCSTLPCKKIGWNPSVGNPAPLVADLNNKIKAIAQMHNYSYLDYYSVLVDDEGGLPPKMTTDGVHVTDACYEIMETMFLAKLKEVLGE